MFQEIFGNLTAPGVAFFAAILALFGTVVAAVFGIVTSFINNWFGDIQAKRKELSESERQARELAVKLALDKWKLESEAEKEDNDARNVERQRNGMAQKSYFPPPIEDIVEEMWRLTTKLKQTPQPEPMETPVRTWKDWLLWPPARCRAWWESR